MSQKQIALNQIEKCFKKSMKRSAKTFHNKWPTPNEEIPESNILLSLGCEFLKNRYECYTEIQINKKDPQKHKDPKEHFDMVAIDHKQKWVLVTEAKFVWGSDSAGKLCEDWNRMKNNWITPSAARATTDYTRYGALFAMTNHERIGDWWNVRARSHKPDGFRSDAWKELASAIRQADRFDCEPFKRAGDEWPMSIMYALFELRKSRR